MTIWGRIGLNINGTPCATVIANALLHHVLRKPEQQWRYLFKKIAETKGNLYTKMSMLKDKNGKDLLEKEEVKKTWHKYTKELYKRTPKSMTCTKVWSLSYKQAFWKVRLNAPRKYCKPQSFRGWWNPSRSSKILWVKTGTAYTVGATGLQKISLYGKIKKSSTKECSSYWTINIIPHAINILL